MVGIFYEAFKERKNTLNKAKRVKISGFGRLQKKSIFRLKGLLQDLRNIAGKTSAAV